MADRRVNELREILHANRLETQDDAALRAAVARQEAAMRANREPSVSNPTELRARAAELEQRVPPAHAGPRTDDERMWLEKAAALRTEADRLDADRDTEK